MYKKQHKKEETEPFPAWIYEEDNQESDVDNQQDKLEKKRYPEKRSSSPLYVFSPLFHEYIDHTPDAH
jgi:hypothetical protein